MPLSNLQWQAFVKEFFSGANNTEVHALIWKELFSCVDTSQMACYSVTTYIFPSWPRWLPAIISDQWVTFLLSTVRDLEESAVKITWPPPHLLASPFLFLLHFDSSCNLAIAVACTRFYFLFFSLIFFSWMITAYLMLAGFPSKFSILNLALSESISF